MAHRQLPKWAGVSGSEVHALDKWRQWNMAGNGDAEGKNGDIYYREHSLFNKRYPVRRLVKAPGGQWIELIQALTRADWGPVESAGTYYIYAPTIGVLSRWPDDEFTVDEMHKRNKYLMLMELIDHCDNCLTGVSGSTLQQTGTYGRRKDVTDMVNDYYGRWDVYRNQFKLGWPSLPENYRDELFEDIMNRINNYNDPKAATKRNRQKARREAVKALMGD